jgi:hypothetical protein
MAAVSYPEGSFRERIGVLRERGGLVCAEVEKPRVDATRAGVVVCGDPEETVCVDIQFLQWRALDRRGGGPDCEWFAAD